MAKTIKLEGWLAVEEGELEDLIAGNRKFASFTADSNKSILNSLVEGFGDFVWVKMPITIEIPELRAKGKVKEGK